MGESVPVPSVLIHAPGLGGWLSFRQPLAIIEARRLEDVLPALEEVQDQVVRAGKFAAGFLAYESAPAFDPAFQVHALMPAPASAPLVWFGVYARAGLLGGIVPPAGEAPEPTFRLPVGWRPDVSREVYQAAIERVKAHIAGGETYQVNYTYRLRAPFDGAPWKTFAALAEAHRPPYAAFIETEDWAVCSLSPELFFTQQGDLLTTRPMKGTARRGRLLEDDLELADWLHHSEKNRAENVMIVDMARNDLGRIARIGSVVVPELFKIEKYSTVWQMTSTVQAETSAGLVEIVRALFPAASITGAPKIRTMQIIAALEASPRQVYTGAIGYFSPDRRAQFNVAIRTLWINKRRQQAEYGVGGGIVWDSEAESEWQETRDKARLLVELPQPFDLLETLRWTPEGGWWLLDEHLERLERSAAYFDFSFERQAILERLAALEAGFEGRPQRLRLALARDGRLSLETAPLPQAHPRQVELARTPVRSSERFLYHKTTRRAVYNQARRETPAADETLLWNERGELTEACIANLALELDGELFTPPVECGLLPGTYRLQLLKEGKIKERVLRLEDLGRCTRILLFNSLRGMWEVQLLAHEPAAP